jgi:hypothetical protein
VAFCAFFVRRFRRLAADNQSGNRLTLPPFAEIFTAEQDVVGDVKRL